MNKQHLIDFLREQIERLESIRSTDYHVRVSKPIGANETPTGQVIMYIEYTDLDQQVKYTTEYLKSKQ